MQVESYRDLLVWKKGIAIAKVCYFITRSFPKEELFGLTSQIRRAAASIPANVAEGWGRESTGDYVRFLQIAQGSLKELETHLILATEIGVSTTERTSSALKDAEELGRMLRALIRTLQAMRE